MERAAKQQHLSASADTALPTAILCFAVLFIPFFSFTPLSDGTHLLLCLHFP